MRHERWSSPSPPPAPVVVDLLGIHEDGYHSRSRHCAATNAPDRLHEDSGETWPVGNIGGRCAAQCQHRAQQGAEGSGRPESNCAIPGDAQWDGECVEIGSASRGGLAVPPRRPGCGLPAVPMQHLIQRFASGWLELGAQRVGNRDESYLHDLFVGDAQHVRRLTLEFEMEAGQDGAQTA